MQKHFFLLTRKWPGFGWTGPSTVMLEQVTVHTDKLFIVEAKATIVKVANQPLASEVVKDLEELHHAALTFWGIKLSEEVHVNMAYIPLTDDVNYTLISADLGLTEVSRRLDKV